MASSDADKTSPVGKETPAEDQLKTQLEGQPSDSTSGGQATPPDRPPQKEARHKKKATVLGEFKLLKKLGQGGMGEVYLANQTSLGRKVAIKVLSKQLGQKEDFVKRFYREAKSMAKLDHPNIVRCFAVGEDKGVHYVAIEFIDGKSMQDWINELGKLSVEDAVLVTSECAEALRHAHEANMIHRDVKPDNMLISKKGVIKVSDLGLAKALDEDVSMTQTGTGMGTPLYMAPEQARNAKHVDFRSDIYALGCSLYYFLTGELPYRGENTLELIMAKEKGKFTPAKQLDSALPEKLDLVIEKMIAVDPEHRYGSCKDLIEELEGLQLAGGVLSFIDGAESVAKRSSAPTTPTQTSRQQTTAAVAMTSAEDHEITKSRTSRPDSKETWFVQHTSPEGKKIISKMTPAQVKQGVKTGVVDLRAKVKKDVKSAFVPLARFPEFESVMKNRAVVKRAEMRSQNLQDIYAQIDKQESRRHIWRRIHNLVEGTLGVFSLIVYLAVVAGIGYLAYLFLPMLYEFVAAKLTLE